MTSPLVNQPRCPYCHGEVRPAEEQTACQRCRAWHHSSCLNEGGGRCAACGRGASRSALEDKIRLAYARVLMIAAGALAVCCGVGSYYLGQFLEWSWFGTGLLFVVIFSVVGVIAGWVHRRLLGFDMSELQPDMDRVARGDTVEDPLHPPLPRQDHGVGEAEREEKSRRRREKN